MSIAAPKKKSKSAKKQDGLVKQEDALTVYLQSLLSGGDMASVEASNIESAIVKDSIEVSTDSSLIESRLEKPVIPDVIVTDRKKINSTLSFRPLVSKQSASDQLVSKKLPPKQLSPKQLSLKQAPSLEGKKSLVMAASNVPEWAVSEIKCLSAVVSGINILIPAESIVSIKNVTNCLKPSNKMPTWLYELNDDEDEAIQVVNTQKIIFDGVKIRRIKSNSRTYVVLLDDGSWGLSCDAIGAVVKLENKDIKWRGKNTKRRWLAGTCSGREAVILDVQKIEKALIC